MNEETFTQNYSQYRVATFRFLINKGVSRELAEDVAQTAWAKAWEKREQWNQTAKFHSWVNAIAWNMLLGLKRKREEQQLPENFNPVATPVSFDDRIDAETVLSKCSPTEQELLTEVYTNGSSLVEIADATKVTKGCIRLRVMRLRNKLKVAITKCRVKKRRRSPRPRTKGNWHTAECEWCGGDFAYRSTLLPNSKPRYPRRFCKRSCVASYAHRDRRKMPMNPGRLRELYVVRRMTTTQIAKLFGCSTHKTVCRALEKFGIPRRPCYAVSSGKCRLCGDPVVRKKDGTVAMRLCRKHQTEYQTNWARLVRSKDPEVGFRRLGRKLKERPCPRCGENVLGARAAMNHCPKSSVRQDQSRRGWETRRANLGMVA